MSRTARRFTRRPEVGTPAVVCLELCERPDEPINVTRIAVRNHVEIERGNRGALDDCGHPLTSTKRTRWRRNIASTAANSVGCRGTAQRGHQLDVILQDGQALGRCEARHPADQSQVDAGVSPSPQALPRTLHWFGHRVAVHNPSGASEQPGYRLATKRPRAPLSTRQRTRLTAWIPKRKPSGRTWTRIRFARGYYCWHLSVGT